MSSSESTNLWLLLEVVARRKRFILSFVGSLTILALIVSLLLPVYYKASSLLLPPKDTSLPMAGLSRLADVVSVTKGLNLPVMVTTTDVYARMLQSRTVIQPVIDSHLSLEKLHARNADEAFENFLKSADFKVTGEGLLEVSYEDQDPDLAAAVVNSLVEQLDKVNRQIATSRARQNREFIDERLRQVKSELDSTRAALEHFQTTHKAVDFDQQIRLATDQAIELKITLAEIDINLTMMRDKYSPDNSELIELEHRRAAIYNQIETLENSNADSSYFSLPISLIPALRSEYEILYSKVRVNEALYQTLLSQFEQAKIQENEELPTITVLDTAKPPQLKNRPKRAYVVLGTFGFSLILVLLLASFFEYLGRLKQTRPDDYKRAATFLNAYLGWLPSVKRMKKS